jgi:hypothetical protein
MDNLATGLKTSILIICCLASQSLAAANYFTWNADSPTTSVGTCNLGGVSIVTNEKHQGTGSMRLNIADGGEQGHHGCLDLPQTPLGFTWDSGKTIYYRWWMKIDPGFNWGNTSFGFKGIRLLENGNAAITPKLKPTGVDVSECLECNSCSSGDGCLSVSYNFTPGGPNNVTSWHEYIYALTFQTGATTNDAKLELFVDGVSRGKDTGKHMRDCSGGCSEVVTATWGNAFAQALYAQLCSSPANCGSGGNIWVDDFSVDDKWNSTVGPQPNPPTLLPVQ